MACALRKTSKKSSLFCRTKEASPPQQYWNNVSVVFKDELLLFQFHVSIREICGEGKAHAPSIKRGLSKLLLFQLQFLTKEQFGALLE